MGQARQFYLVRPVAAAFARAVSGLTRKMTRWFMLIECVTAQGATKDAPVMLPPYE